MLVSWNNNSMGTVSCFSLQKDYCFLSLPVHPEMQHLGVCSRDTAVTSVGSFFTDSQSLIH